jgi:CMP-N,N'-diacetyllegionaminic acid synthase
MKKIEIVGIVPVKANSERIKKKNLRQFGNTNLFELKLKQLQKTKSFKYIIVSSEDKKILSIAKKKGFRTHLRDPYYSTSSVPMSEVYSYIGASIKEEHVAWINVTNPLAESKIYDNAVNLYKKNIKNYDCLLSAIEVKENFFYKKKPLNFQRSPWPRSQDLEPLISLPFVINILKKKNLVKWGSCVGKKPFFYILDNLSAKDIDNPIDFEFCETIYKKKNNVTKI